MPKQALLPIFDKLKDHPEALTLQDLQTLGHKSRHVYKKHLWWCLFSLCLDQGHRLHEHDLINTQIEGFTAEIGWYNLLNYYKHTSKESILNAWILEMFSSAFNIHIPQKCLDNLCPEVIGDLFLKPALKKQFPTTIEYACHFRVEKDNTPNSSSNPKIKK